MTVRFGDPLRRRGRSAVPRALSPEPAGPLVWFVWTSEATRYRRAVLVLAHPLRRSRKFLESARPWGFPTSGLSAGLQATTRSTSRVLRRHCRVSPQRRVIESLCRSWSGRCVRGANTVRTKGRLRIRLSKRHPRVGSEVRAANREQARDATPEGAG